MAILQVIPIGQTSWSKALVWHGADPRAALAVVLGKSPDEISVSYRSVNGSPNKVL